MGQQSLGIVAIGDELLLGRRVDTNSASIATRLVDHGLLVQQVRLVDDEILHIAAALRELADTCRLVIVTGGLGPTDDDRTRDALAMVMGVGLRQDGAVLQRIERRYLRLRPGKPMPASNRRQALVPVGAESLDNDRGTAPGLLARVGETWIACLPGVPHEMAAMLERLCQRLPQLLPGLPVPSVAEIACAGIGESALQDALGELANPRSPRLGITAHDTGHITLRAVGAPTAVRRHLGQLRRILKPWLLPEADLASSLVAVLGRSEARIAVAESCTCGRLALALGVIPGVSTVFHEGVIAYHDRVKEQRLAVPVAHLRRHGAVSQPVVEAMATGLRAGSGADLCLATSGIAGPGGGSARKPVGTVWLAAASAKGVVSRRVHIPGSRERVQRRAAAQALLLGWQWWTGRMPEGG